MRLSGRSVVWLGCWSLLLLVVDAAWPLGAQPSSRALDPSSADASRLRYTAHAQTALPERTGYVTDRANLLSESERKDLAAKLAGFARETRAEAALLIVPELGGTPIEQFSRDVATRWQLGGKGVAKGVLLALAVKERRSRIEVGSPLEAALSNDFCAKILSETLAPLFKQQRYFEGIDRAFGQLLAQLSAPRR